MAGQNELVKMIVDKLDEAGIAYMLCGSVGASFFGLVRATQDADIVIDPSREQLMKFIRLLGDSYYVSTEAAVEALKQRSMFNVIEVEHAMKADLIIKKTAEFDASAFDRRRKHAMQNSQIWVASAEDIILSKLRWGADSGSELQYRDALRVAGIQRDNLDKEYMQRWASVLGIEEQLHEIFKDAEDAEKS